MNISYCIKLIIVIVRAPPNTKALRHQVNLPVFCDVRKISVGELVCVILYIRFNIASFNALNLQIKQSFVTLYQGNGIFSFQICYSKVLKYKLFFTFDSLKKNKRLVDMILIIFVVMNLCFSNNKKSSQFSCVDILTGLPTGIA